MQSIYTLLKFIFISLLSLSPIHTQASNCTKIYQQASEQIITIFEDNFHQLSDYSKAHWGLRRWRQTGDSKYAPWVNLDIQRVKNKLDQYAAIIEKGEAEVADYVELKANQYRTSESSRSVRRYHAVGENKIYYLLGPLITALARYSEYQLQHPFDPLFRQFIKKYPFTQYALNTAMLTEWAAPLSNQVYWLKQLGISDITKSYNQFYKNLYSQEKDRNLSNKQYKNKIYGMTHIIIADSEYYQSVVDAKEHAWILNYFEKNIEQIIERTKADIVIEVGLSFLLAGKTNTPALNKIKSWVAQQIHHEHGYILSSSGRTEMDAGEHRNIIATLLLNWNSPQKRPLDTLTQQFLSTRQ